LPIALVRRPAFGSALVFSALIQPVGTPTRPRERKAWQAFCVSSALRCEGTGLFGLAIGVLDPVRVLNRHHD